MGTYADDLKLCKKYRNFRKMSGEHKADTWRGGGYCRLSLGLVELRLGFFSFWLSSYGSSLDDDITKFSGLHAPTGGRTF